MDDDYKQLGPKGTRCVPSDYQATMPEARDIRWNDDFFDDEEGTIAVFDFDYQQMEDYTVSVNLLNVFCTALIFAAYGFFFFDLYGAIGAAGFFLLFVPLLRIQTRWNVQSNHLAITRDGIRYVQDKRKSCLGLSMCDKGKNSKTVPFDKITDCDIQEPAGNTCLVIPRVLFVVNVDTASSGGGDGNGKRLHELMIPGLLEPHKFKALVWAMKRQRDSNLGGNGGYAAPPSQLEMTERTAAATGGEDGNVTNLLKDIRDELRENNKLLKNMRDGDAEAMIKPTPTQELKQALVAAGHPQAGEIVGEIV